MRVAITSKYAFSVLVVFILPPNPTLAGPFAFMTRDQARALYAEREKRWEPVLRDAGSNKSGLILESRVVRSPVADGGRADVVVYMRNVNDRAVRVDVVEPLEPDLWVRKQDGRMAELTNEGLAYYTQLLGAGRAAVGTPMPPGYAAGCVVPFTDYFAFSPPASYTVVATLTLPRWRGELGGLMVARPLEFKVTKGSAAKTSSEAKAPTAPNRPGDQEWVDRARTAGRMHRGCILEASVSPVARDPTGLVVTLLCVGDSRDAGDALESGRDAADYRVLVRGPNGRRAQVKEGMPRPRVARGAGRAEHSFHLGRGSGVGAFIPLGSWYDMREPGEYTVLATLPSLRESQPPWVAEPLVVKVPPDRAPAD